MLGIVGVGGYLLWTRVLGNKDPLTAPADDPPKTNPILPGGDPIGYDPDTGKPLYGGFREIPADTAYPDHPLQGNLLLDPLYDAAWNWMARFREVNYDAYGNTVFTRSPL